MGGEVAEGASWLAGDNTSRDNWVDSCGKLHAGDKRGLCVHTRAVSKRLPGPCWKQNVGLHWPWLWSNRAVLRRVLQSYFLKELIPCIPCAPPPGSSQQEHKHHQATHRTPRTDLLMLKIHRTKHKSSRETEQLRGERQNSKVPGRTEVPGAKKVTMRRPNAL